jgi:hypothetical protein
MSVWDLPPVIYVKSENVQKFVIVPLIWLDGLYF